MLLLVPCHTTLYLVKIVRVPVPGPNTRKPKSAFEETVKITFFWSIWFKSKAQHDVVVVGTGHTPAISFKLSQWNLLYYVNTHTAYNWIFFFYLFIFFSFSVFWFLITYRRTCIETDRQTHKFIIICSHGNKS